MDQMKRANDSKQPLAQIPAQGSEAAATLPQRIGESASGLLKDALEQHSTRAVTGVLASFNTDNAKAGSSSNSRDTADSSLVFRSSSRSEQTTSDQGESFRSTEKGSKFGKTHGQVAFDEFLAGPDDLGDESEFSQDGPTLSGDQQSEFPFGIAKGNMPQVQDWRTWKIHDENQDYADQDNDGAAVVALLSDPAFTVGDEPSSTLDQENDRGEGRAYESLQTGKGLGKPVDALHPSKPLDLVPEFGAPWHSSPASSATQKIIHERRHSMESIFGDVQPWIDVLDRYHDEVWGDMLPLVKEAREDLRAANEGQTCLQDGPAIRRLKMVLQHLDDPDNP